MRLSLPSVVTVLGLLFGAIVALSIASSRSNTRLAEARADARAARAAAAGALALADSTLAYAASTKRDNARLASQRDSALATAESFERFGHAQSDAFHRLIAEAPTDCQALVETASIALLAKDSAIAEQHRALAISDSIAKNAQRSADSLRIALRFLSTSTVKLSDATKALEQAGKPSLLSRLTPRVGVGAAAGVDAFGRPNAVLGITVGWSF